MMNEKKDDALRTFTYRKGRGDFYTVSLIKTYLPKSLTNLHFPSTFSVVNAIDTIGGMFSM